MCIFHGSLIVFTFWSQSSSYFALGVVGVGKIGWIGNQTSKSAKEVLDDVLTVPHPEDVLVDFKIKYKHNIGSNKTSKLKSWSWSNSGSVEYERVIYPFGRCVKLKVPTKLKDSQIIFMKIEPNTTSMETNSVQRIKIYFKDPEFDSKFLSGSFKPSNNDIDFASRNHGGKIFRF